MKLKLFSVHALTHVWHAHTGNLQDVLRLLTLWFNHGSGAEAEAALQEGFALVSIDTWLVVIPQIIARIHTNNPQVGLGLGSGLQGSGAWHRIGILFDGAARIHGCMSKIACVSVLLPSLLFTPNSGRHFAFCTGMCRP